MRHSDLPIVRPSDSILAGLAAIDLAGCEVALVVDADHLVGILTDGDVRRALLRGVALSAPVSEAMQQHFTSVGPDEGRAEVLDIMKARAFTQIPVVDESGRLVGLHLLKDIIGPMVRPNVALILCGGLGTRLHPITRHIPKGMVPVAGRPILERIVLHLVGHGFRHLFLAVHHLGHLIEEHFGNGDDHGCRIDYIREPRPLGTGGAIGLLPCQPDAPILVMNGDLVTQFDPGHMLGVHAEQSNFATIGVHTYAHEVPFGVLETRGASVVAIQEKPIIRLAVNAGIYVLDPSIQRHVVAGEPVDLPILLERCLRSGLRIGHANVDETWVDVGRESELQRARGAS